VDLGRAAGLLCPEPGARCPASTGALDEAAIPADQFDEEVRLVHVERSPTTDGGPVRMATGITGGYRSAFFSADAAGGGIQQS
jgi:hypothetical protein